MFPHQTIPGLHPDITLSCCIGDGFLSTGTHHPKWTPKKRMRGKSPVSCFGPPRSSAPGCSASGQASGWWPAPVWTGGSGDQRSSTPCPQEQKFHRKGNNKPRRVILRREQVPETGRTFLPLQDKQAHWGSPSYALPSRCAYGSLSRVLVAEDGSSALTPWGEVSLALCSRHKVDELLVGESRSVGPVRWLRQ